MQTLEPYIRLLHSNIPKSAKAGATDSELGSLSRNLNEHLENFCTAIAVLESNTLRGNVAVVCLKDLRQVLDACFYVNPSSTSSSSSWSQARINTAVLALRASHLLSDVSSGFEVGDNDVCEQIHNLALSAIRSGIPDVVEEGSKYVTVEIIRSWDGMDRDGIGKLIHCISCTTTTTSMNMATSSGAFEALFSLASLVVGIAFPLHPLAVEKSLAPWLVENLRFAAHHNHFQNNNNTSFTSSPNLAQNNNNNDNSSNGLRWSTIEQLLSFAQNFHHVVSRSVKETFSSPPPNNNSNESSVDSSLPSSSSCESSLISILTEAPALVAILTVQWATHEHLARANCLISTMSCFAGSFSGHLRVATCEAVMDAQFLHWFEKTLLKETEVPVLSVDILSPSSSSMVSPQSSFAGSPISNPNFSPMSTNNNNNNNNQNGLSPSSASPLQSPSTTTNHNHNHDPNAPPSDSPFATRSELQLVWNALDDPFGSSSSGGTSHHQNNSSSSSSSASHLRRAAASMGEPPEGPPPLQTALLYLISQLLPQLVERTTVLFHIVPIHNYTIRYLGMTRDMQIGATLATELESHSSSGLDRFVLSVRSETCYADLKTMRVTGAAFEQYGQSLWTPLRPTKLCPLRYAVTVDRGAMDNANAADAAEQQQLHSTRRNNSNNNTRNDSFTNPVTRRLQVQARMRQRADVESNEDYQMTTLSLITTYLPIVLNYFNFARSDVQRTLITSCVSQLFKSQLRSNPFVRPVLETLKDNFLQFFVDSFALVENLLSIDRLLMACEGFCEFFPDDVFSMVQKGISDQIFGLSRRLGEKLEQVRGSSPPGSDFMSSSNNFNRNRGMMNSNNNGSAASAAVQQCEGVLARCYSVLIRLRQSQQQELQRQQREREFLEQQERQKEQDEKKQQQKRKSNKVENRKKKNDDDDDDDEDEEEDIDEDVDHENENGHGEVEVEVEAAEHGDIEEPDHQQNLAVAVSSAAASSSSSSSTLSAPPTDAPNGTSASALYDHQTQNPRVLARALFSSSPASSFAATSRKIVAALKQTLYELNYLASLTLHTSSSSTKQKEEQHQHHQSSAEFLKQHQQQYLAQQKRQEELLADLFTLLSTEEAQTLTNLELADSGLISSLISFIVPQIPSHPLTPAEQHALRTARTKKRIETFAMIYGETQQQKILREKQQQRKEAEEAEANSTIQKEEQELIVSSSSSRIASPLLLTTPTKQQQHQQRQQQQQSPSSVFKRKQPKDRSVLVDFLAYEIDVYARSVRDRVPLTRQVLIDLGDENNNSAAATAATRRGASSTTTTNMFGEEISISTENDDDDGHQRARAPSSSMALTEGHCKSLRGSMEAALSCGAMFVGLAPESLLIQYNNSTMMQNKSDSGAIVVVQNDSGEDLYDSVNKKKKKQPEQQKEKQQKKGMKRSGSTSGNNLDHQNYESDDVVTERRRRITAAALRQRNLRGGSQNDDDAEEEDENTSSDEDDTSTSMSSSIASTPSYGNEDEDDDNQEDEDEDTDDYFSSTSASSPRQRSRQLMLGEEEEDDDYFSNDNENNNSSSRSDFYDDDDDDDQQQEQEPLHLAEPEKYLSVHWLASVGACLTNLEKEKYDHRTAIEASDPGAKIRAGRNNNNSNSVSNNSSTNRTTTTSPSSATAPAVIDPVSCALEYLNHAREDSALSHLSLARAQHWSALDQHKARRQQQQEEQALLKNKSSSSSSTLRRKQQQQQVSTGISSPITPTTTSASSTSSRFEFSPICYVIEERRSSFQTTRVYRFEPAHSVAVRAGFAARRFSDELTFRETKSGTTRIQSLTFQFALDRSYSASLLPEKNLGSFLTASGYLDENSNESMMIQQQQHQQQTLCSPIGSPAVALLRLLHTHGHLPRVPNCDVIDELALRSASASALLIAQHPTAMTSCLPQWLTDLILYTPILLSSHTRRRLAKFFVIGARRSFAKGLVASKLNADRVLFDVVPVEVTVDEATAESAIDSSSSHRHHHSTSTSSNRLQGHVTRQVRRVLRWPKNNNNSQTKHVDPSSSSSTTSHKKFQPTVISLDDDEDEDDGLGLIPTAKKKKLLLQEQQRRTSSPPPTIAVDPFAWLDAEVSCEAAIMESAGDLLPASLAFEGDVGTGTGPSFQVLASLAESLATNQLSKIWRKTRESNSNTDGDGSSFFLFPQAVRRDDPISIGRLRLVGAALARTWCDDRLFPLPLDSSLFEAMQGIIATSMDLSRRTPFTSSSFAILSQVCPEGLSNTLTTLQNLSVAALQLCDEVLPEILAEGCESLGEDLIKVCFDRVLEKEKKTQQSSASNSNNSDNAAKSSSSSPSLSASEIKSTLESMWLTNCVPGTEDVPVVGLDLDLELEVHHLPRYLSVMHEAITGLKLPASVFGLENNTTATTTSRLSSPVSNKNNRRTVAGSGRFSSPSSPISPTANREMPTSSSSSSFFRSTTNININSNNNNSSSSSSSSYYFPNGISSIENNDVISGVQLVLDGFAEVAPLWPLLLLTPEELCKEICGEVASSSSSNSNLCWTPNQVSSILVADHGYNSQSLQIKWLAEVVAEISSSPRSTSSTSLVGKFLSFITGCPALPAGGLDAVGPVKVVMKINNNAIPPSSNLFTNNNNTSNENPTVTSDDSTSASAMATPPKALRPKIVLDDDDENGNETATMMNKNDTNKKSTETLFIEELKELGLPSVNTCVRYLKLPPYSRKDFLERALMLAITDGNEGFELS